MNKFFVLLLAFFLPLWADAQISTADIDDADENQTELRLNPEFESESEIAVNYSDYPFLNLDANHIEFNGADWSGLQRSVLNSQLGEGITSVVYLGDSHVQADFNGAIVRERLSERLGAAGRGLIIPFKAAGTNEPFDYTFTFPEPYRSSKLLKQPWETIMPFSGIGIEPVNTQFNIEISCKTPFDRITFFYEGSGSVSISKAVADGVEQIFGAADTDDGVYEIAFRELLDQVTLTFERHGSVTFAGAMLSSDITGAYVHSVGNNGATYSSYNSVPSFGREFAVLEPDLVMIALGTNEAFGKIDPSEVLYNIDELIKTIQAHNPEARILLVTPTECKKRMSTRRKGSRRRTVTLVDNPKVATMRNLILNYARENGVAVYDTYAVTGSADNLRSAELLSKDGVHFTATGYRLLGNLLADAIIEAMI
ncbi:MAG: hypothetical protein HDT09_04415 [Bacteroidales bacterium]|nr:hypothetical protein [Bacteroidales bacterium]